MGKFKMSKFNRTHGENILTSGENSISCSFKSVYRTQNGFKLRLKSFKPQIVSKSGSEIYKLLKLVLGQIFQKKYSRLPFFPPTDEDRPLLGQDEREMEARPPVWAGISRGKLGRTRSGPDRVEMWKKNHLFYFIEISINLEFSKKWKICQKYNGAMKFEYFIWSFIYLWYFLVDLLHEHGGVFLHNSMKKKNDKNTKRHFFLCTIRVNIVFPFFPVGHTCFIHTIFRWKIYGPIYYHPTGYRQPICCTNFSTREVEQVTSPTVHDYLSRPNLKTQIPL